MLRTTMICNAVDDSFNSHPVRFTEGDGGVDDIYIEDNGWVKITYTSGDACLIPSHMVSIIRKEWV